jgi:transcriptional regulator with XRE-family HTH domain
MTLGQVICELRSGMGMSQGRLAEELNKVSGRITLTREDVSRWECGKRMPGPFWLPHLSIALKIPLAQLEAAKIGRGPLDSRADDIRGLMAWVADSNTTDAAIEQITQAVAYLAESHSQIPQQIVLAGVLQAHQKVRDLLRSGKQRLRQTRELLRLDSELLAYAGMLLGNLGQDLKAVDYGTAALMLAQEAGSDEAIAWSVQAKTARWQRNYVESAEAARKGFEISAMSPTKVELAYREANAIALFGDAGRAWQALRRARETAEELPANCGSPKSVWSFPTGRQAIFELSVAIHTGDPDSALRAAAMAYAGWASGEPKVTANHAQIQAGSSIAYLMKGSLEEAAYHVAPVLQLPSALRISTVTGYLRKLESLLTQPRFANSGTADSLSMQIRDFISSPRPAMDTAEAR